MNREPINKQNLSDAVAEKLREYIRSSDAPRSLKLPPEAVIGESMGVSRITVRRALSDLEQEGLIQRIHGRGTFINPNISKIKATITPGQDLHQLIRESGYESRNELISLETVPADLHHAEALEVAPGSPLIKVVCSYYANDILAIVSINHIPEGLLKTMPSREEWGTHTSYELLRTHAGLLVTNECITIQSKSRAEALTITPAAGEFDCDSFLCMTGTSLTAENKPALSGQHIAPHPCWSPHFPPYFPPFSKSIPIAMHFSRPKKRSLFYLLFISVIR